MSDLSDSRLDRIEQRIDAVEAKTGGKDKWDKIAVLGNLLVPILSAVVVLVVGWYIKDSIEIALRQQEVEISAGAGMADLLTGLRGAATPSEAEAAAVSLAAFGRAAIAPLVNEMNKGSLTAQDAAAEALFVLGLTHPEATCHVLTRVLDNRSRQFSWQSHRRVIRLIGAIGCGAAVDSLHRYHALVADDSEPARRAYAKILRNATPPDIEDVVLMREDIGQVLQQIGK